MRPSHNSGVPIHASELRYRPDIDGLRALAVLLVLGFHLQISPFYGGFVGVDVFFVISGYLLTGIIAKEIEGNRFSVAAFYERRARRILPALLAVLMATTWLSFYYLLPGEFISYAKSLLGATFSYSNFYFWSATGYFDTPAQSKPLLHTWSLAVEEQFYVVLPLLLVFLSRRWPRNRNATILALAALSFACSAWLAFRRPASAFYLPWSRAWELLTGSILALNIFPALNQRWLREWAAFGGVVLIGIAAGMFNTRTPFPGIAALLPCAGSLLILAAGRHGTSVVGKLLSLRPVTFVGLISYSLYLWHWPLVVFTRMGFLPLLSRLAYKPSVLILSLLMATLSWQFVEKPFRVGALRGISRNRLFGLAAGSLVLCGAVALLITTERGFRSRFPGNAVQVAELMNIPQETRLGRCFVTSLDRFEDFKPELCMQLDQGKKNYLLLGDSHAASLWYGLSEKMTASHILQANVSGCNPVIGTLGHKPCARMMVYVFRDFLAVHPVDAILLTARWSTVKDFEDLYPTVAWCVRNRLPLIILGPVMEYDAPLPKLLAYSLAFKDPGLAQRHERTELLEMDRAMRRKAEMDWHVQYISLIDTQCPQGECLNYADSPGSIALMGDDNHLSNAGSRLIVEKLLTSGQLPSQLQH